MQKKELRHQRIRDQILRAARELLLENGHDNFSLRGIARRVQYSPAALYEYFDNKDEIGANFSVVKNKEILVNIYAGLKNEDEPWDENTIVNTFSLSKGVYAAS